MNSERARYAVFGHPVSHSRSPDIHAHFADQTGQAMVYSAIDPGAQGFTESVARFFSEGGQGANVTLPFKEQALDQADQLGEHARQAGAVNTLKRLEDGRLLGENTDGIGFVRDLRRNLRVNIEACRVLLLGAGGAARGVVGPLLASAVAELHIANRRPQRAVELAEHFAGEIPVTGGPLDGLPPGAFDLIINATATSVLGQSLSLPASLTHPGSFCYDLAYADDGTPFTRWARSQGLAHSDGWGMLVEQAAESFFLWRGIRPDTLALLRR